MSANASIFNRGDTKDYYVFSKGKYMGQLIDCYKGIMSSQPEYHHAFIYHAKAKPHEQRWWRADGTPYPKDQVPKEYLAMCLLVVV